MKMFLHHKWICALVVTTIATLGWCLARSADADVRRSQPRAHFKSGAARSEKVLREILAQLKQSDARLAKIEAFINKVDNLTRPQARPVEQRPLRSGYRQPSDRIRR